MTKQLPLIAALKSLMDEVHFGLLFQHWGACPFSLHSSTIVLTNKRLMAHESSVFKASPRRQGGGGSPCLRSRLSPPRRRLGDKAVVDRSPRLTALKT